jgi:hypothetical protein
MSEDLKSIDENPKGYHSTSVEYEEPNNNNINNTDKLTESERSDKDEKSDKIDKTSIKDDESSLQKELDQIETDFATLSNNFKKRRLSKNEMDFLESEMNLDLETVTDADFDIHLQKLIGDNVSTADHKIEKVPFKEPKKILDNEELQPKEQSVLRNPTIVEEAISNVRESENIEITRSNVTKEAEIKKNVPDIVEKPLSKNKTFTKTNKKNNKQTTSFIIGSTTTDTYKGRSIPANSELLKDTEQSSVLQAYRDLVNNGRASDIKEANHVNAQLSALPLLLTAPDNLSFNVQMLINTLPVLDNLATQILRIIAKGPYQKVMELVSNRESYTGIAFGNLIELFETTKRIYNSEESPFFTVENITFGIWKYGYPAPNFLKGREDTIEGTLRKVNLATFLLATLGLIDLGFFFLNEAFLDVFCPPQNLDPTDSLTFVRDQAMFEKGHKSEKFLKYQKNQTKFLKAQAILYLELKTQAYISAIELGDRSKEDIIHDLFPENMDDILLRRKDPFFDPEIKIERNATFFTPAELDFLSRCDFRKQTLLNSSTDSSLMEKYEWIKFLNDLLEYVSKNVGFLIWGPKGKLSSELNKLNALKEPSTLKVEQDELDELLEESKLSEEEYRKRKIELLEKTLAESANQSLETDSVIDVIQTKADSKEPSALPESPTSKEGEFNGEKFESLHFPTSKASKSKSKSTKKTKQNRPSTFRRIWTDEEEAALREGLKLKGTHWTAILELFGPGGQINESLKNRSSLQLKDKARNWKFYYIKNNLPIPDYLSKATGDLDKYKKAISSTNTKTNNTPHIPAPPPGPHKKILRKDRMMDYVEPSGKRQKTESKDKSVSENIAETSTSVNVVNSFAEAEEAVYQDMFKELLPVDADTTKEVSKGDALVHDEVVASELKDLVAQAFK